MKINKESEITDGIKKFFKSYIGKTIGFIFILFFNISFFIVINFYTKYIPFTTDEIKRWLIFANISIFISILAQFLLVFLRGNLYRMPVEIIQDIGSLFSTAALRIIYPFNFSSRKWLDWMENIEFLDRVEERFQSANVNFWVKFSLLLVIIIICLGILIKVIKFITVIIRKI